MTAPEVNRGRTVLGIYEAGSVVAERVLYRAVQKMNLGKLPFALECMSAGDAYVLPVESFLAITQHTSAGAVLGMDTVEFLGTVAACTEASAEQLTALAGYMKMKTKKAGGTFMTRVTSPCNGIYVIRSGSLKITLPSQRHRVASVSGEAPSITFTSGDVVSEQALHDLAWQCQESGGAQGSTLGGNAPGEVERLITTADVSYLHLDEAGRAHVPERMAWVADNLIFFKLLKTMEVHAHLSAPRVFQLSRSDTALLTRSCPLHVPCLHARHGARPDAYVHGHVHVHVHVMCVAFCDAVIFAGLSRP